ncbi:MAG: sigma-70 family RNA polymerase sigma factor [Candidatus Limnocylindria bacterium]
MTHEDDARLLAAVRRGEPDAFDPFYDRFSRPLYALGLRWLGNPADAEELVSESLVRAWRAAGNYDPGRGRVASWLFGIAHNVARDRWRAGGRNAAEPLSDIQAPSVADGTDALIDALDIGVALESLSQAHRDILVMTYAHLATESEIASLHGIASGTVKSRRFYALRALARQLGAPSGQ